MLSRLRIVRSALLALSLGATTALAMPAHADDRPVSVGPYAQVSIGGQKMVGKTKRRTNEGPKLAMRVGTDLFSWFSVGGRLDLASHEVVLPRPPEGEYTQFYGAAGEARLSVSIGRVALYAEGSLGYSMISTNVLETVDILEPGETFSPTIGAGGGLEYQLQNRHYAFGLGGEWNLLTQFAQMHTVNVSAHMRYTY
jgi:hypothetical protein